MITSRNLRRLFNKKNKRSAGQNRPFLDPLEPRILLSAEVAHWIGGSGNWSDPTHWDTGAAPNNANGNTYTAIINQPGVVVDMTGSVNVTGLSLGTGDTLKVDTGGSLSALGSVTNTGNVQASGGAVNFNGATVANAGGFITTDGGSVNISGGAITGGTIQSTTNGGTLSELGSSILDNVTLDAPTMVSDYSFLTIKDGLTLNSTLTLGSNGGGYTRVYFYGTQTLSGTGQVDFAGNSADYMYAEGDGGSNPATLTIGQNITIDDVSQSGYLQGYYSNDTFINQGTIDADTSGATITVGGADWINMGLLNTENGGALNLAGTFTTAGIGTFNRAGGTINLIGTLDNTGNTIVLDGPYFSIWNFADGGTIKGGTITANSGSLITSISGTLDNVTLNTNLTIQGGSSLTVQDGLVLNGTLTLSNTGWNYPTLYLNGTETISGTGQLVFGGTYSYGSYAFDNVYLESNGSSSTVTLGPDITLVGNQSGYVYANGSTLINQGNVEEDTSGTTLTISDSSGGFINQGSIEASNGGNLTISGLDNAAGETVSITGGGTLNLTHWQNNGTIAANGSTLTLDGSWPNTGVISETNSTVNLGGTFTIANLGTFNTSGGTINLIGTLDNTGNTIVLDGPYFSIWNFADGGTIKGGTITANSGSLITSISGTLDNVTLNTNLTIQGGNSLTVQDGLVLNGTLTLSNTGWNYPTLYLNGTETSPARASSSSEGLTATALMLLTTFISNRTEASTVTLGPDITLVGNQSGYVSAQRLYPHQPGERRVHDGATFSSECALTM